LNEAKQAVPSHILCGIGVRFNCMGGEMLLNRSAIRVCRNSANDVAGNIFLVLQPDWNIAVGKVSLSVPSEDRYSSVVDVADEPILGVLCVEPRLRRPVPRRTYG
jgi:hypothetical protein